jgi:hypothetical protein
METVEGFSVWGRDDGSRPCIIDSGWFRRNPVLSLCGKVRKGESTGFGATQNLGSVSYKLCDLSLGFLICKMDVETTAGSLIRFLQVFNTDSV